MNLRLHFMKRILQTLVCIAPLLFISIIVVCYPSTLRAFLYYDHSSLSFCQTLMLYTISMIGFVYFVFFYLLNQPTQFRGWFVWSLSFGFLMLEERFSLSKHIWRAFFGGGSGLPASAFSEVILMCIYMGWGAIITIYFLLTISPTKKTHYILIFAFLFSLLSLSLDILPHFIDLDSRLLVEIIEEYCETFTLSLYMVFGIDAFFETRFIS